MPNYDFQVGGVPIDVSLSALDNELMQLHESITRLWLEIGEWTREPCFDQAEY